MKEQLAREATIIVFMCIKTYGSLYIQYTQKETYAYIQSYITFCAALVYIFVAQMWQIQFFVSPTQTFVKPCHKFPLQYCFLNTTRGGCNGTNPKRAVIGLYISNNQQKKKYANMQEYLKNKINNYKRGGNLKDVINRSKTFFAKSLRSLPRLSVKQTTNKKSIKIYVEKQCISTTNYSKIHYRFLFPGLIL